MGVVTLRDFEERYREEHKKEYPDFEAGDVVNVVLNVRDGEKVIKQNFKGVVIQRKHPNTNRETFTVRKVSYGVAIERVFPILLPDIEKIEIIQRGVVRRARLFYLRDRYGRAAKVKIPKQVGKKRMLDECVTGEEKVEDMGPTDIKDQSKSTEGKSSKKGIRSSGRKCVTVLGSEGKDDSVSNRVDENDVTKTT